MDKTKYNFTNTWFDNTTAGTWEHLIPAINPTNYLEIGAYEGASVCFVIETIAPEHGINVFAIDTWEGGVEHNKDEMPEVEKRFDENIKIAAAGLEDRVHVTKLKGYSDKEMIKLAANGMYNYFDLIYIDGSHLNRDVLSDAILAFKLLRVGGYIIFDDYNWRMALQDGRILNGAFTKLAIDTFINTYFESIALVPGTTLAQVVIRKMGH